MTAHTASEVPVRKSITVQASVEHAFDVYTKGFDTWWPREHHIGKSPMKRAIIEGVAGGRCYSEQVDGTECDWGRIVVWDPPHRFVMAWQISPTWQYEPDLAKSSEVEVRFTSQADGSTRVDLEHRHFGRHGAGGDQIRTAVEGPGGWGGLLELFKARAESVSKA